MKGIPSTPTDNLYKFSAVTGLWFLAGIIALSVWLFNLGVKLDRESANSSIYWRSISIKNELERNLESLQKGDESSNSIIWSPESLKAQIAGHNEVIKKYKQYINTETGKELVLFERIEVIIVGVIYLLLTAFLLVYGFGGWFRKIHKKDIQIKDLDIKIKQKTLEKLSLEIVQLNKIDTNEYSDKHHFTIDLLNIKKLDFVESREPCCFKKIYNKVFKRN